MRQYEYMHHNHAGVVSLSEDASEVVITLTKAIYLDSSYQVIHQHVCYFYLFMGGAILNASKHLGVCSVGLGSAHLQVVGRAHKGLAILQKLNEAPVDPDDLPLQPIMVLACGLTDSEACSFTANDAILIYQK